MLSGDYEKFDKDQIIVLSNVNKIKEQSFKRRKNQSILITLPMSWVDSNFPQGAKSGKVSIHSVEIHGEHCLAIRRIK